MSDDDLTAIEGVGPKTVEKIREAATQARLEWEAHDAAEEADRVAAEQAAEQAQADQAQVEHAQAEPAKPEDEAADVEAAAAPPATTDAEAPEAAPAAEGTGQSPQEDATDGER
jgi:hypothetical protein